ncbi:hypothetical protein IAR55_006810 [Kwoniella newhampshirensis]|uniref:Uncharacterized protein n=1 Tax=Kwoniella newhampshirensis TaxID=1651941 RepID=A0AAW0YWK4_9TREE
MVYIKSSVLVAAAAFSATASALPAYDTTASGPTSSPSKAAINVNLNLGGDQAVPVQSLVLPSSSPSTDDGPTSTETGLASATANVADLVDVDVKVTKRAQKSPSASQASKAGSVLKAQPSKEQPSPTPFGSQSKNDKVWRGRLGRRGPWRNVPGDDLLDINLGEIVEASSSSLPAALPSSVPHRTGDLINLDLRSPRHDDEDRAALTGDGEAYYRNANSEFRSGRAHAEVHEHEHEHLKRHSHHGNHHSVLEVIGDGYRSHGNRYDDIIVDDGRAHDHTHEHFHGENGHVYGKRRHEDHDIIEIIHNDHHEKVHDHEHIHEHMDKRRHADSDRVEYKHVGRPIEVIEDGGRYRHLPYRPHEHEVAVIEAGHGHDHVHDHEDIYARSHGREGDVIVVQGGSHRHGGDVTVVNNDNNDRPHRHHSGATTVVNNKRDIPGLTSRLAALGRAFLKKSRSHDDQHSHEGSGSTTIVNNAGGGHRGHSDDTVIVNNSPDRHHYHGASDTTVINNKKRHHSERILVVGDERRYHNADFYYRNSWDRGLRNGRPIYFTNGDDFNRVRVVENGRHGDYVSPVPYDSTVGYEPVGYEYYKRSHGGESRKERHSKHGKAKSPSSSSSSEKAGPAKEAEKDSTEEKRRWGGDDDHVTVVNEGGKHHHHGGDVTIVNNEKRRHEQDDRHDSERYCHDGRCDFARHNDHHRHHDDGYHYTHHEGSGHDVTVVNNMAKRYHDEHRHHDQHHGHEHDHHESEECRDGRCDRRGGDDVTVVNNHKRQVGMNGMGGAPGYIDVTSPVFNSTTAQRIASLVLSTSNGTDANSTFVLNASNNIRTQVYLVPVNPSSSTAGAPTMSAASSSNSSTMASPSSTPLQVNLKLPIFVASSASVEPYCATFDPSPESPAPLTVMPCTNDTSTHESQVFLYNPDTGMIHPDWQPSADAQQLLQAVPDNVDDSQDDAMLTASASATMVGADSYQTGSVTDSGDYQTLSDSIAYSPTAAATGWVRRATNVASPTTSTVTSSSPSTSSTVPTSTSTSGSTSTSAPASASGSSTSSASSPPPLITSGPNTSTDSKALPQSSTNASNVTLIFTPATPAMINNAASLSDSDDTDDAEVNDQQPQTQATLTRRWHMPDYDGEGRHLNREAYTGDLPSGHPRPVVPVFTSSASAKASRATVTPIAQAMALPKGDSTMPIVQPNAGSQRPMVAPQSLTAPYE